MGRFSMFPTIFTIGHSTHSAEYFVGLLNQHEITAICDVRSSPYSQFNPQFSQDKLKKNLHENGIQYVFLGDELGARSNDPTCYRNGKVEFDILAKTKLFKQGIERIRKGSEKYQIALVCAEKEPLDCHRTILVSRELENEGMPVAHILADGEVETHETTIERLKKSQNRDNGDLFMSESELQNDVYKKQSDLIAYSPSEAANKKNGNQEGSL